MPKTNNKPHIAFYVTVLRSMLALGLGVALLFQPDKARPILGNFMGLYWLVSALLSIRWGIAQQGSKWLAIGIGVVGVLTGLGMLGRGWIANFIHEDMLSTILGVVIVLTGLLHVSGRLKTRQTRLHMRTRTGMVLGVFEVILGMLLIIAPLQWGRLLYTAVFIWAILGGFILMGDALYMRRAAQEEG